MSETAGVRNRKRPNQQTCFMTLGTLNSGTTGRAESIGSLVVFCIRGTPEPSEVLVDSNLIDRNCAFAALRSLL